MTDAGIFVNACAPAHDIDAYDYALDESRIAVSPYSRRDEARLLVCGRRDGSISSERFSGIIKHFRPGDMLVLNETKVFRARLYGTKNPTGARIEFLLLRRTGEFEFESLIRPARRVSPGTIVDVDGGVLSAEVIEKTSDEGVFRLMLHPRAPGDLFGLIDSCGHVPLPPYIVRNKPEGAGEGGDGDEDREGYQTVYARVTGSVAAPTAGFHFTGPLLSTLQSMGVTIEKVVLHVGLGTFKLVEAKDVRTHRMHREPVTVSAGAHERIREFIGRKKSSGGRLFCCGTTSVRAIESLDMLKYIEESGEYQADTDLFIYEGYGFKYADAMITNFHLPKSTLLMMVGAFMGLSNMRRAYERAVSDGYMFYSYGDAMLIL